MIPEKLSALVEKQAGNVHRSNIDSVNQALMKLDVPVESEFAEFFLTYTITLFLSDVSDEELCDIAEPSEQIKDGTEFVHEVWGLPENYICFTTVEGEGCYLYDKITGKVWDFELKTRDSFLRGEISAKWGGFYKFMIWYLGG
ncbi:hypothetical protein [Zooshikella harenae]|uniref:SMI1/KNR4 family protein n=1 Tax=Zooshikella harenae TaxID=2827238 RepID=A0ABS5ZJL1_9GAMM|nr:hypothetical protein [Zooshikella harenae]MBU2714279.1 hypothetical protein [Zooshikella harenae]